MNKIKSLFLVLIITFCPAFIKAATIYSLFDLAKIANQESQTIKIAHDSLNIAKLDKKRAISVLIPSLKAFGSYKGYESPDVYNPDALTKGVKLTHSFNLRGKELIAYSIAKNNIIEKKFSLKSIQSQYLLQTAQAYYNILSVQRQLEIANSNVKRLSAHTNAVKEKLIVGQVAITDLYRSKAELSKSITEQVTAKNNLEKTKAALLNLVLINEDFELAKEEIIDIKNYKTSLKEIQKKALLKRPEIKEATTALQTAKKTIKYNKDDYWPSLSLELGYTQTDTDYDAPLGSSIDTSNETEDTYFAGTLSFTLFDAGLRSAQIKQALAMHRQAKNALILAKDKIRLESKTAFLDFQTATTTFQNLQDELKSAQENYNAVQMQFEQGLADSIDMMDANTLLVTAQRRILNAKYAKNLAVLKILYAKNELIDFLLHKI